MAQPPDPPYDSGNPEHVKARKNRNQIAEERRKQDLLRVWGTEAGRRVMWDLLGRCGVHRTSYRLGNPALHDCVFREGMRNVGLSIEADVMAACPEFYFLAQQEANHTQQKEKEEETHE